MATITSEPPTSLILQECNCGTDRPRKPTTIAIWNRSHLWPLVLGTEGLARVALWGLSSCRAGLGLLVAWVVPGLVLLWVSWAVGAGLDRRDMLPVYRMVGTALDWVEHFDRDFLKVV